MLPDVAVGAVVAALIAGLVSFLGLIVSKEQKTSEFRQAWIDNLRNNLTDFLTQINTIHDAVKINYKDHAEKLAALRPHYSSLNNSTFNILLRVNSHEKISKALLDDMGQFNELMRDESKLTFDNIRRIEENFISNANALLKSEWRRVKLGEPAFQIAKIAAFFVVIGSFMILGAKFFGWI